MLATFILLSSLLLTLGDSNVLFTESTKPLRYYLCTEKGQRQMAVPGTVLQLSEEGNNLIDPSSKFCVLKSFSNLTIMGNGSKPSVITCNRSSDPSHFTIARGCGLGFVNGTDLKLVGLTFHLFGSALNVHVIGTDNDTALPTYFGTNQTASLLFSNIFNLTILSLRVTEYYGYGIIVVNAFGNSALSKIEVDSSLSHYVCLLIPQDSLSHDNYTCFGSGLLIYFHDILNNQTKPTNALINLTNSVFHNNTYNDSHSLCVTNVFQFQPERVPIFAGAGLTIFASQKNFNVSIALQGLSITNNNGAISGGLAVIFINTPFKTAVAIRNTTIQKNKNRFFSCVGTGLIMYVYFTNSFLNGPSSSQTIGRENYMETWVPLQLFDVNIVNHRGYNRSSTVYLGLRSQPLYEISVFFEEILFMNNEGFFTGICLFAETAYEPIQTSPRLLRVYLKNVNAMSNAQSMMNGHVMLGNSSQFVFYRVGRVTIEGESPLKSSFVNNSGSVIDVFGSEIYLKGLVEFKHNTASVGAAVLLRSNSFLIFAENSSILFENNVAYKDGGAIYSVERGTEDDYCVIQIDSDKRNVSDLNITVNLINNTAFGSGPTAFLTPLFHCFQTRVHVYPRHLSTLYGAIFGLQGDDLYSQLATIPTHVCTCEFNGTKHEPNCSSNLEPYYIFPGDQINISLVAFDDVNNEVVSQINSSLSNISASTLPLHGWHIPSSQEISTIPLKECFYLTFTVYSNGSPEQGQLNFAVPGHPPQSSIEIHIKACPPGFELVNRTCVCVDFLKEHGLVCNAVAKTIHRPLHSWIGIVNISENSTPSSVIGYASYCPVGYCNNSIEQMVINSSKTSMCINNRAGPLCGNCIEGYSAMHGGTECRKCSDRGLWWLVGNISSGLITVLVLFLFKITLNAGTLVGVVFYANTYNIIKTLNIDKTYFIPFMQLIELMNLHQAFPSCLFSGMEYAYNYIIQYAYSVYLWMIIFVLIILARCSPRVSRLLMTSSVQVLMTLAHLSFAKILSATIDCFAYAEIHINQEHHTYLAWLYNGTIPYGTGVHLPLLVIASLSSVFFIVPFLFLGILGSLCLRFRFVDKIRPIIDVIHSPYQDCYRFWYGARLLLLVILAVINPSLRGYSPFSQLLLQLLMVSMFTIVQAYIKPFSHKWINLLDMWCMVNVIALIIINLYGAYGGLHAENLLFLSIFTMSITTLLVFGYHIVLFLGRITSRLNFCKRWKESANIWITVIDSNLQYPSRNGYSDIDNPNVKNFELTTSEDYSRLRESLLEYSSH